MTEAVAWTIAALLGLAGAAAEVLLMWISLREAAEVEERHAADRIRRTRPGPAKSLYLAFASLTPGVAHASRDPEPAAAVENPFALQFNLDFTNAYFYRGIIQEDTGLIVQPAARLTATLHESEEFTLDGVVSVWNSVHGQRTATRTEDDFRAAWYEADVFAGFVVERGPISLTAIYAVLASPSDAFETVQELDVTLAYDDSELLGPLALHPSVLLAFETGANGSDGAGTDPGAYLELGVSPGFEIPARAGPVAISFPISVGLSLYNYYEDDSGDDDRFGFIQAGIRASIPLPIADGWGDWSLNAGLSGLFLGDHASGYNGGDGEQIIGTIGLQVSF